MRRRRLIVSLVALSAAVALPPSVFAGRSEPPAGRPSLPPFVPPKDLDDFIARLQSEPYFMMMFAAHDRVLAEKFLREGVKKAPARHPWALEFSSLFAMDAMEARDLSGPARTARFQHALAYLQEASPLAAQAAREAPGDKSANEGAVLLEGDMAVAALEAGQVELAKRYASAQLAKNTDRKSWNYGNVVHDMNQVLGRAALRQGNLDEAKRYLLAAGASPGSPQLDSFGPQLHLAKELLAKGEKDAVLQYLDLVGRFWAHDKGTTPLGKGLAAEHAATLARWKADIRAGRTPDDRRWK